MKFCLICSQLPQIDLKVSSTIPVLYFDHRQHDVTNIYSCYKLSLFSGTIPRVVVKRISFNNWQETLHQPNLLSEPK